MGQLAKRRHRWGSGSRLKREGKIVGASVSMAAPESRITPWQMPGPRRS